MRYLAAVFALLALLGCAFAASRDSNYNNICFVTGGCTGGGGGASPIMFQHIASSTNPVGNGISGRAFIIPTEALPANSVAVMFVSALASKTVTISDTLGATWTNACSASGGTGNAKAWVFTAPITAGGVDSDHDWRGEHRTHSPFNYLTFTIWEIINTTTSCWRFALLGN